MLKATDLNKLQGVGWKYFHSTPDEDAKYVYRFSVLKYKNTPTLIGQISVGEVSKIATLDVFNASNGQIYVPFYYSPYGNTKDFIDGLKKTLYKECNKYGIKNQIKVGNKYVLRNGVL